MSPEERLIAFVDDELPPAEAAAFERDLATNSSLAAQVAQQRRLRERLSAAYSPVLDEPTPDRLVLAACAANENRGRFGVLQVAAVAASLAIGVVVGLLVPHEQGGLATRGGSLVARGDLARALDSQLSAQAAPIRVGLSFREAGGAYCRAFRSTPDGLAGLACHDNGQWVVRATSAWRPAAEPRYRTASSELPQPLLAAIDELILGEPLDAAGELAARDHGWTR